MNNIVLFDKELIEYVDKKIFEDKFQNSQILAIDIINDVQIDKNIFVFAVNNMFFLSSDFINFIHKYNTVSNNIKINIILVNKDNSSSDIILKWFEKINENFNLHFEIISNMSLQKYIEKINEMLNSILGKKSESQESSNNNQVTTKEKNNNITIYTDGACSGNPGAGGWGAVLICGNDTKEISGFDAVTTNNKMELTAVIKALSALKYKCNVELFSDSAYVVNAINLGWLENWKKNNWVGSDKKPVKNIELWQELDYLLNKHTVIFNKVKGHSDNELNNRCDRLAVGEIEKNIK